MSHGNEYDGSFSKSFKKYDEVQTYNEYDEHKVEFDPSFLTLDSTTDIHNIMKEINELSFKIYKYGSLCDAQNRVVQQLEDEFERWKAEILSRDSIDDKQYKSEKAKERYLMVNYAEEYQSYQNSLSSENYRLTMLKRVVKSLEGYGYKLHDLKEYSFAIERNS